MIEQKDMKKFRKWLIGVLSTNEKVDVTFTKSDGTERLMKCTLKEGIVTPYERKTEKTKESNEDILPVWDLEKGQWRSFRLDSVKEIKFSFEGEGK